MSGGWCTTELPSVDADLVDLCEASRLRTPTHADVSEALVRLSGRRPTQLLRPLLDMSTNSAKCRSLSLKKILGIS